MVAVEGDPNLDATARSLDGTKVAEFGNAKIFVNEDMRVLLSVARVAYKSHAGELKAMVFQLWRDHKITTHLDEGNAADDDSAGCPSSVEIVLYVTLEMLFTSVRHSLITLHQAWVGPVQHQARQSRNR